MLRKFILPIVLSSIVYPALAEDASSAPVKQVASATSSGSIAKPAMPGAQSLVNATQVKQNPATFTPPHTVNKIVAYVNRRIITENELQKQIIQTKASLQQRGLGSTDIKDIRARVLDQLILQQIQLDLANRSGIKTSDSEVNDALLNIEKSQGVTEQQMRSKLAQQGISFDDFRQQINDQITAEKLKQREVDGRVTVNDDEVNRILNSETYKNRIDYRIADILVSIPEQATQQVVAQKEALANQIYAQLKQGASFDQMSIKYSSAPNALTGGDLGWKSNTSLPPIVLDPISKTPKGSVTPVVKMPVGFFIFKVNDIKQHGSPQIVHQYHVRHILVKVNELTSDDEAHQKIIMVRDQLMKDKGNPDQLNKDFIALAKQYSEDTSSIKGGDIGWVSKGDTVPQFEAAVIKTPIGQISDPIRSPFGWHILQVLETRDSNLANDREKAEIRQELRDTKAQMMYTEWIRNLREMSYVKLTDE